MLYRGSRCKSSFRKISLELTFHLRISEMNFTYIRVLEFTEPQFSVMSCVSCRGVRDGLRCTSMMVNQKEFKKAVAFLWMRKTMQISCTQFNLNSCSDVRCLQEFLFTRAEILASSSAAFIDAVTHTPEVDLMGVRRQYLFSAKFVRTVQLPTFNFCQIKHNWNGFQWTTSICIVYFTYPKQFYVKSKSYLSISENLSAISNFVSSIMHLWLVPPFN